MKPIQTHSDPVKTSKNQFLPSFFSNLFYRFSSCRRFRGLEPIGWVYRVFYVYRVSGTKKPSRMAARLSYRVLFLKLIFFLPSFRCHPATNWFGVRSSYCVAWKFIIFFFLVFRRTSNSVKDAASMPRSDAKEEKLMPWIIHRPFRLPRYFFVCVSCFVFTELFFSMTNKNEHTNRRKPPQLYRVFLRTELFFYSITDVEWNVPT